MQKIWEYRLRAVAGTVRVLRVKGVLDVDAFTFACSLADAKTWIRNYEQRNGRGAPILLPDPYIEPSRVVPMLNF
jgi:hypothetical protein